MGHESFGVVSFVMGHESFGVVSFDIQPPYKVKCGQ